MFVWTEYLRFAEQLLSDGGDEAALRSAISRSYYAAYHAAATFVRSTGLLRSGHTHRRVWLALTEVEEFERLQLWQRGERLKSLRELADYRNPFPTDLGDVASFAVAEARDLIDTLATLSAR